MNAARCVSGDRIGEFCGKILRFCVFMQTIYKQMQTLKTGPPGFVPEYYMR